MKNNVVIGIAGGSGSGKSTMINLIKKEFNEDITIISHDFYYKCHDEIPLEERRKLNYDHPDAFDTDIMIAQLKELTAVNQLNCPVYDYTVDNRK